MANDFTFYLDENDIKRLENTLRGLSTLEREASIKEALDRGMTNMVQVGRIALKRTMLHPTKSKGNLYKSLTSKVQGGNQKHNAKGVAGFKRSTRYSKIGGGNHSYLVDRGTAERWQRRTGRYTGSVRKNSPKTGSLFWTRTVQTEGPKALDMLMEGINDAIIKILNRN